MKNLNRTAIAIRWIARIWGSLIVGFALIFLVAHIFGTEESGAGFQDTLELITFICFPIGTVIGLLIAYKWERLGGLIACLGLIVGHVIILIDGQFPNKFEDFNILILFFPPGLLYLIYWFLSKKRNATQHTI